MCIEIAHNPGSLDTLAMPASCILQRLALLLLVLYICLSGLLILFPSTASTKLTAHKNTHRMFVCFVCLDRQEVPWAFGDNFLVKLCIFSFHVWKKKKKETNWLLYSCLLSFSLYFLLWRQISYFFFFLSPQHARIISLLINRHLQLKYCIEERNEGADPGLTK